MKTPSRGRPGANTTEPRHQPPHCSVGRCAEPPALCQKRPRSRGGTRGPTQGSPHPALPHVPALPWGFRFRAGFCSARSPKHPGAGSGATLPGAAPCGTGAGARPAGPSLTGGSRGGERLRWGRVSAAVWQEEEAKWRGRAAQRSSWRGPAGLRAQLWSWAGLCGPAPQHLGPRGAQKSPSGVCERLP